MDTMRASDGVTEDRSAGSDSVAQSRAELLRRIDEIWDRRYEIEVEPPRGMKKMVDSQDEYLERIRTITRRITGR